MRIRLACRPAKHTPGNPTGECGIGTQLRQGHPGPVDPLTHIPAIWQGMLVSTSYDTAVTPYFSVYSSRSPKIVQQICQIVTRHLVLFTC